MGEEGEGKEKRVWKRVGGNEAGWGGGRKEEGEGKEERVWRRGGGK